MKFTKEDVEEFKKLVEQTKIGGRVIAQLLVDAGLGKWKPGFEPKKDAKEQVILLGPQKRQTFEDRLTEEDRELLRGMLVGI
jgi:hypothetical protein